MRFLSLLSVILLTAAAPAVFAQHQHPVETPAGAATAPAPAMKCEAMMHEMHASSKAMDDRLQQLVEQMNGASGSAKVDRMAAVLNELVAQRKQMHAQMMAMMPTMMGHMSEHMQSGMMQGMTNSMKDCPMMKGKEAAPAEHKH